MSALELIIIIACMAGSFFFSGIETGLISINRLRLRHLVRHKIKGADILQDFLNHPDHLLGTTLVGNNIVNTVIATVMASVGTRMFGVSGNWIFSAIATLILLVFCEYLPKAWFSSFPSRRCLPFARPLQIIGQILYPISRVLMGIVKYMTPFIKNTEQDKKATITRDEVLHLVREGHSAGALSNDEVRMIKGVFELRTTPCSDIMVPRKDMVYIHQDTSHDDISMFARAQQVSQFPVHDREKQTFVGIVYMVDVLSDPTPSGKSARDYMRPPQLVAAVTPVDHVLPRMRVTKQPIVLVANEKYDVVGYVTLDMVLDEIVGA